MTDRLLKSEAERIFREVASMRQYVATVNEGDHLKFIVCDLLGGSPEMSVDELISDAVEIVSRPLVEPEPETLEPPEPPPGYVLLRDYSSDPVPGAMFWHSHSSMWLNKLPRSLGYNSNFIYAVPQHPVMEE